jgi:hypothetical protein
MRRQTLVPAAQWRRGMEASERIGRWLKAWEDRARSLKNDEEIDERPPRRRRPPRES